MGLPGTPTATIPIQDVSFVVDDTPETGEFITIIGPSGCGKSTVLNLIAGFDTHLPPTSGEVLIHGKPVTGPGADRGTYRARRAGRDRPTAARANPPWARALVPADQYPRPADGARERATGSAGRRSCAGPIAHATGKRDQTDRARNGGPRARIAGTLAHGQQRQLEIAMALAAAPKVLLLDEPLAGMGPEEGERIAQLLKSLAVEHAVLLIEHDMDFVFAVADRLTVLVEGAVLATGRPEDVRVNPAVQSAYLGGHA